MLADDGQIDLDEVLSHLPMPVVILERGSGRICYANHAARRLDFAFRPDPAWRVRDERGAPVDPEALPHSEAARGQCFDHVLLHFDRGDARHTLRFHCHALGAQRAVLSCEDLTPLDRTLATAAHELRSPLAALQLIADRLARKADGRADLVRLADAAGRQTRRLGVLASNLLDVTRIRAGRFALDLAPASLAEIIEEACEPLRDQAQALGVPLVLDLADRAEGRWDRVRMEQLVVNLVSNALKYGAPPIEVRLRRHDHHVELSVADDGPGVDPASQGTIFDPFSRADARHATHSLGLGLFVVREIVSAHGGELRLASRPGHTVFTIELPLRD